MAENSTDNQWRRFTTMAGLCILLLAAAMPATAQPVVVFGPQKFTREEGKPATTGTIFRVPAEVDNCRLEISSDTAGPLAANNVSVKVNGMEMTNATGPKNRSFTPTEVALQETNSLLVTLKGKPGDSITVTIIGEKTTDSPPPPPLAPPD